MELQNIIVNQLLKMDISYVRVNGSHLDEEFILLQTLMSRSNMLLNLLMKEKTIKLCFKIELIQTIWSGYQRNKLELENIGFHPMEQICVLTVSVSRKDRTDLRPYSICIKKDAKQFLDNFFYENTFFSTSILLLYSL